MMNILIGSVFLVGLFGLTAKAMFFKTAGHVAFQTTKLIARPFSTLTFFYIDLIEISTNFNDLFLCMFSRFLDIDF